MTMSQELINRLVAQVAGEDTVKLVETLMELGENTSEFILAEKLEMPINHVRNMLYRLQENNLVTSFRKKDRQRGWYIYYWTFSTTEAETLMKKLKSNRITYLRKRIEQEQDKQYFTCPKKCLRLTIQNALEFGFKCPECDSPLKEADNKKQVGLLRKELEVLESENTPVSVEA